MCNLLVKNWVPKFAGFRGPQWHGLWYHNWSNSCKWLRHTNCRRGGATAINAQYSRSMWYRWCWLFLLAFQGLFRRVLQSSYHHGWYLDLNRVSHLLNTFPIIVGVFHLVFCLLNYKFGHLAVRKLEFSPRSSIKSHK